MTDNEGKSVLTEIVQKQMVVLGPNIALETARSVAGIKADNLGKVELKGDFVLAVKALADEYIRLSGMVFEMSMTEIFEKYPQIKILIKRNGA